MATNANNGALRSAAGELAPDSNRLSPASLVAAAMTLDVLVVSLLTWTVARAGGLSLWPAEEPLAVLCLAVPLITLFGAWVSLGFSFRHAHAFASHLGRTAAGSTALLLGALALYLGISGAAASDAVFIAALAVIGICALHANYLGVVRTLARAGVFSLPQVPARE